MVLVRPGTAARRPAIFQYAVTIDRKTDKGIEPYEEGAFMWVPPQAQRVRGVVMAGMTLMEREFVKDPVIRAACAEQSLALIFTKVGLEGYDAQKVLNDLAAKSGYKEVAVAPLCFVGHSAGGPQARNLAVKYANRCFGLVQYRGGPPWDAAVAAGIPTLMMVGEFDEFGGMMRNAEGREHWEGVKNGLAGWRKKDAAHLASVVVEPGAGHFAWSDRNAAYLALWLKKAAAAKIPASWEGTASPALLKVDPASGWETDLDLSKSRQMWAASAAKSGDGEAKVGNWHFDKELAEATVAYHHPPVGASFGKKDQFIDWKDPFSVDAGARFFFDKTTWVDDGQTFEVHPVYADKYPSQYNGQGPRWADTGKPVGHSAAPIRVKVVGGPIAVAGDPAGHKFRFAYDALAPAKNGGRITFMAYSQGDAEYRYTEHVGMLPRSFNGFTEGKDQTITFETIPNMPATSAGVPLKATSDAGLPVSFYVAYGPATIQDGKLIPSEVPARAAGNIEVKVVAYQFGRGIQPRVKTAEYVERVLKIEK